MADKQQLVLSIIDFLRKSIDDGSVKQDDKEGLEVAMQCIGEAFGVDPLDQKQRDQLSIKPANLQTIFDVFLKTKEKVGSGSRAATSPLPSAPSPQDKAEAEKLKQSGNSQMSNKQYDLAINMYTQAIALDPTNPVYYSNRAAAHSSKGDHLSAIGDAEKAITVDSSFVKSYHRLGHAQYSIGDFKAAASTFRRGLEKDPTNASLKSGLQNAEVRIVPEDDGDDDDGPPPLIPDDGSSPSPSAGTGSVPGADAGPAGMADMLRNFGGAGAGAGAGSSGGAGGMPDIAGFMNNPMMMQMAQQMMANGGMEKLMQNPAVSDMLNRVQSGGGMPSMDEIMSDPSLRNLATQFGAGGV